MERSNKKLRADELLSEQAERYIEAWQQRQAETESLSYPFDSLAVGTEFTLPGGLTRQTKINGWQARVGAQLIRYHGWERVIPVCGRDLI